MNKMIILEEIASTAVPLILCDTERAFGSPLAQVSEVCPFVVEEQRRTFRKNNPYSLCCNCTIFHVICLLSMRNPLGELKSVQPNSNVEVVVSCSYF